jgi:hypothetical protein
MRTELETLQLIDKYLNGNLNTEDKAVFESEMASNQSLNIQVETQALIIKAIKRKALKEQISAISNSGTSGWNSSFISAIIVTSILAASMSFLQMRKGDEASIAQMDSASIEQVMVETQAAENITDVEGNSILSFDGLHVWEQPEIQSFLLNAEAGATIEGVDGTLVIVPSDAFINENGNTLKGAINVALIEALTLDKMVMYNLTTDADGRPLQTGGMIKLNYSQNGKEVFVDPERPLLIQIPAKEINPDMQLFEGEVTEEGDLNWKNPKPLEKFLVNVDFELLDFKPDGFASAVKSLAKESLYFGQEEAEIDSVYYSLDWETDMPEAAVQEKAGTIFSKEIIETANLFQVDQSQGFSSSRLVEGQIDEIQADSSAPEVNADTLVEIAPFCGINPRSIETIKTVPFAETFIATREFAARLSELHNLKDGDQYLKLYLKNLKLDLWEVDSMVANRLKGDEALVFHRFAKEKLTNVKDLNIHQFALNDYYFRNLTKNKKAAAERNKKAAKKSNTELRIALKSIQQEKQAAISALPVPEKVSYDLRPIASSATIWPVISNPNSVVNSAAYSFFWASNAWANIDSYMKLLEGQARIVGVSLDANFKNRKVYQWINTVKTLASLNGNTEGNYQARFPEYGNAGSNQMKETFVLAVSEKEGEYEWAMKKYQPYEISQVMLEAKITDKTQIKRELRALGLANLNVIERFEDEAKQLKTIIAEREAFVRQNKVYNDSLNKINARYNAEERKVLEKKRLRDIQNRKDLIQVMSLINPCGVTTVFSDANEEMAVIEFVDIPDPILTQDLAIYTIVEESPEPIGGTKQMFKLLAEASKNYPLTESGKVFVQFIVNEDGSMSDFEALRAPSKTLGDLAIQMVQESGIQFTPGKNRGAAVRTYYKLPVNFSLR